MSKDDKGDQKMAIDNFNLVVRFIKSFITFLRTNSEYIIYYEDIFSNKPDFRYPAIQSLFSRMWDNFDLLQ